MQPSDIAHLVVPSDPQVHPDGRRVAVVVSRPDLDEDRYQRVVHVHDGETLRPFTHGPGDTSPRWSPDGRWLALLRTGSTDDAKPQLAVMPADGGEASVRTDLPLGVSEPAWAPDSRRLVVVGKQWAPALAELEDDDERRRVPKRITRLPYRGDTDGQLHERRQQLWLVDREGEDEPRSLTAGDDRPESPVWRPDGRAIAYLSPSMDELEPDSRVLELELDTGETRELVAPGMWSRVLYDPDGRVFVVGLERPCHWPGSNAVWRVDDVDGEPRPVGVTTHLDRDVLNGSGSPQAFVGDGLVTTLEDAGTVQLVRLDDRLAGGASADDAPGLERLVGGPRCVTGYSATADGAVAFTVTDTTTPGELCWWQDGTERVLSSFGDDFRAEVAVHPTEAFTVTRDGHDIDVWAVLPPGFDTAAPGSVPVLFNVHGGPTAQYGEQFFDEFQVEAAAGYLVVGANPRGSSGRGTDWARAIVGGWTQEDSVDTLDLEAVIDGALARYDAADPQRVGVMGGSYGGYATARLLARTGRYGSAIVERGLLQWESFSGTSDIGPHFDRMFLGVSLADGAEPHHAASPVRTAHRVTAPTLVLHSEHDWRCPIEQAEQLFVALKRAGVETELLRFPDEGHELSRSGAPKHRVERFEAVLEWHARHLGG